MRVLTREQVVENISRLQMHYAYPISFATDLLAHDAALRAINTELLDALKIAESYLFTDRIPTDALVQIKQAIAKAEGGETK